MPLINVKLKKLHAPRGDIHPRAYHPGPHDVSEETAEVFIRNGWATPLDAGTAANGQPEPPPAPPESPASGPAKQSSASPAALASPKPRRKRAAPRKRAAKPA